MFAPRRQSDGRGRYYCLLSSNSGDGPLDTCGIPSSFNCLLHSPYHFAMVSRHLLSVLSALIILACACATVVHDDNSQNGHEYRMSRNVCALIARSVSSKTDVFYPGSPTYDRDISHFVNSSAQAAECTVEPGTTGDVGTILEILGSTKTPFSVKGGGHASNPGFSSSPGVQIAMYRFTEVTYLSETRTVVVGSGLVWDPVYAGLSPHNVTVLGGRITGIGVAGFALGGGYSWKTNQYGLSLDTVLAYELVKPNGRVVVVTKESEPELFFALKGGYNNFGIITRFTFQTFPQGEVWGGPILFNGSQISAFKAATAKFSSVADPKASMVMSYAFILGQLVPGIIAFYDGPTPPPGIFDDFLAIPSVSNDAKTRDYLSFILSAPNGSQIGSRQITHTVSLLEHTPKLLDVIINETTYWGSNLVNGTSPYLSYTVEPFLPSIFSHNISATAYPANRSIGYNPLDISFSWNDECYDIEAHDAIHQSMKRIYDAAIAEGQDISNAPLYPNYAIYDTPLTKIYGSNVELLKKVKMAADPHNVMGLAGGFKF